MDNENIISPWEKSFAELIPSMVNIGDDIYKKIVKQPTDNVAMEGRCRATITYTSYMELYRVAFDSTFLRGDYKTFVTGDDEVLPGLELAVKSMKRGEESHFIIPYKFLFGELGCSPRIKPKADCLYVIQLIKFSKIGDEAATESVVDEDRRKYHVMIDKIMEVKQSGVDHFRQGSYVKAAAAFHRAINRLEMCQLSNENEEKEQRGHLITLYTDVMICYNKLNKPKQACSAFKDLDRLGGTSKNVKALFQHGKALMALGEFDRSKEFLKKAYRLEPSNPETTNVLRTLDKKSQEHKTMESNLWRKAMGNAEPYIPPDKPSEVNEDFKETVRQSILDFKNDPNAPKKGIPNCLSQSEIASIQDLVKDMEMKLVISEVHGKKSCYLTKLRK